MRSEAILFGNGFELHDKSRLADPSVTAHEDRLASVCLPAFLDDPSELAFLTSATDKGTTPGGSCFMMKATRLPNLYGILEALDLDFTHGRAVSEA